MYYNYIFSSALTWYFIWPLVTFLRKFDLCTLSPSFSNGDGQYLLTCTCGVTIIIKNLQYKHGYIVVGFKIATLPLIALRSR